MIDQTRMDKLAVMGYEELLKPIGNDGLKLRIKTMKAFIKSYEGLAKAAEAELRLRGVK